MSFGNFPLQSTQQQHRVFNSAKGTSSGQCLNRRQVHCGLHSPEEAPPPRNAVVRQPMPVLTSRCVMNPSSLYDTVLPGLGVRPRVAPLRNGSFTSVLGLSEHPWRTWAGACSSKPILAWKQRNISPRACTVASYSALTHLRRRLKRNIAVRLPGQAKWLQFHGPQRRWFFCRLRG